MSLKIKEGHLVLKIFGGVGGGGGMTLNPLEKSEYI